MVISFPSYLILGEQVITNAIQNCLSRLGKQMCLDLSLWNLSKHLFGTIYNHYCDKMI